MAFPISAREVNMDVILGYAINRFSMRHTIILTLLIRIWFLANRKPYL